MKASSLQPRQERRRRECIANTQRWRAAHPFHMIWLRFVQRLNRRVGFATRFTWKTHGQLAFAFALRSCSLPPEELHCAVLVWDRKASYVDLHCLSLISRQEALHRARTMPLHDRVSTIRTGLQQHC